MSTEFFRYTLIFITRGNKVLMLHRRNPPNRGLWNGVGGHLESGESPRDGALREVREETGYELPSINFAGVLTWEGHSETPGGLYIFTVEVPEGIEPLPEADQEGQLAWKSREWILSSTDVVSNIHYFGPFIFGKDKLSSNAIEALPDFHFVYAEGDRIICWEIRKYLNEYQ